MSLWPVLELRCQMGYVKQAAELQLYSPMLINHRETHLWAALPLPTAIGTSPVPLGYDLEREERMAAPCIWGALLSLVMHSVKAAGKHHILLTSYPISPSLGKPLSMLPVWEMVPLVGIFSSWTGMPGNMDAMAQSQTGTA